VPVLRNPAQELSEEEEASRPVQVRQDVADRSRDPAGSPFSAPSVEGLLEWQQSHNFDEVQRSPRYDGGLALRLARILRIRDDKPVIEVCTLEELRNIYARQMERWSFSDRLAL
jgi:hypothetical protein